MGFKLAAAGLLDMALPAPHLSLGRPRLHVGAKPQIQAGLEREREREREEGDISFPFSPRAALPGALNAFLKKKKKKLVIPLWQVIPPKPGSHFKKIFSLRTVSPRMSVGGGLELKCSFTGPV